MSVECPQNTRKMSVSPQNVRKVTITKLFKCHNKPQESFLIKIYSPIDVTQSKIYIDEIGIFIYMKKDNITVENS